MGRRSVNVARLRAATLICCSAATAAPAVAQRPSGQLSSELQWLQQEEVVVTNDRAPRRIETIPSSITVITTEQIERSGAQQVPDLLRWYASVEAHDFFGNGAQASVDVRGFGINADSSVLVLVDGRRINGVTLFNTDWTTIPLERVARIEIVRGGNSVLYGAQAVGGVINIITRRGSVERQLTAGIDMGSHGLRKPYVNFSGTSLLGAGSLTWHLNASRLRLKGYREGAALETDTVGAAGTYDSGPFTLDASMGYKDSRLGLPGGVMPDQDRRSGRSDYAVGDDTYVRLVPSYRITSGHRVQLALDQRRTDSTAFTTFSGRRTTVDDQVEQTTISPQYSGVVQLGSVRNRITAGYDHQRSGVRRESSFGSPDNEVTARAIYVTDTASLLEDVLHVDLGLRRETFDFALTSPLGGGEVRASAGKLGVTWNYREGSKLFASVDRSYRVQLLDEPGNPAILRPQVSRSVQIGATHRLSKGTELRAAVFDIRTKDEIVLDPDSFANVNWPDTRRRGLEFEGNVAIRDGLHAFGSYSLQDSTTLSGRYAGRQIPLTPDSKGALGVAWNPLPGWTVDAKARWVRGKILSGDFENTGGWRDSWHVADLGVMYKDKRFTVAAGVLNATNQKFSEVGFSLGSFGHTVYPHPERQFYLNVALHQLFR